MGWLVGSAVWSMVALSVWTVAVLVFCYAFVDITRRAGSGWGLAVWIGLFVVLPVVGPLAYLAVAAALTALRQRREERSEVRIALAGRPPPRRPDDDGHTTAVQVAALMRQIPRY
jgi:hypothetical protein